MADTSWGREDFSSEDLAVLNAALRRMGEAVAGKRARLAELAKEVGIDPAAVDFLSEKSDGKKPFRDVAPDIRALASRLNGLSFEIQLYTDLLGGALTSLRGARESAEASDRARLEFLAGIRYELRTWLDSIIGYSEILREGAQDEAREADVRDHERVLAAANILLSLTNDILHLSAVSRFQADKNTSPAVG